MQHQAPKLPQRKPNRLQGFDYSRDALYFVTNCVQDQRCCLGHIENEVMYPNAFGQIVERQWYWLAERYPYVVLHAFVVMPNHFHGVIEINRDAIGGLSAPLSPVRAGRDQPVQGMPELGQSESGQPEFSSKPLKIKSLSELMGAMKTSSSKQIHLAGLADFAWKRSFHDHIIRDEMAYLRICEYIRTNPLRWKQDAFYGQ